MLKLPVEGGCLCAGVRYRISGEPRGADYCHCRMCRRAAGAPVVARLTVADAAFAWIEGQPAVCRSSADAERLFCPTCGSQLALRDEPDHLDLALASLDDPEAIRPSRHIWTASRICWFETADDLPRYSGNCRVTSAERGSRKPRGESSAGMTLASGSEEQSMKLPLEGGCLCGRMRYRIEGAPRDAGYCHCRMCQRAAGAPVVPWLTAARQEFAWTAGEPAVYASSPGAERLFCPACGSQLVFRALAEPETLDVTLASLDDPAPIAPGHHIWTTSRIPWFETRDDLPRYPERGPASAG
ncbi:MAG TPA: GFA family protein [Geminicoccaceae bacterium]|jgi:hypothetical protein|nr:GFA family protein [Geminicoccaceae bacterium]